ncbi:MAG: diphthine--ammonia ligase [Candidatus Thermoplasmatota archaeon]
MDLAILFSGGKDSLYSAFLAEKYGYKISCLLTIISENPSSYMFHTPSITKVEKQASLIEKPLLTRGTKGLKEKELIDLEKVLLSSIEKFDIQGLVTGAVESAYQASRIQKICNKLDLECFNPLWQKDQMELLKDLIDDKFEVIITGVFAYPLDKRWLGKKIDDNFLKEIKLVRDKYKINPAGEGGEYETFVTNCPLFKKDIEIKDKKIKGKQNSWSMEISIR